MDQSIPVEAAAVRMAINQYICRERDADYEEALTYINGTVHPHLEATKGKHSEGTVFMTRGEEVVIHQLRCGRCPLLGDTQRRWNQGDGSCMYCHHHRDDVKHLLQECPAFHGERSHHLKGEGLEALRRRPDDVLKFLRVIGRLHPRLPPAASAMVIITIAAAAVSART